MRIIIDLQGVQAGNQLCDMNDLVSFVSTITQPVEQHEVYLVLNIAFPESTIRIRKIFENWIPPQRIQTLELFYDKVDDSPESPCYKRVVQKIYQNFIQNIKPDILLAVHPFGVQKAAFELLNLSPENVIELSNAAEEPFSWNEFIQAACQAIKNYRTNTTSTKKNSPFEKKPRLAYVSPLPPEQTGIASYSVSLLPELLHHFDIDLITDQIPVEPFLSFSLPQRSTAWFEANGTSYDRILYHMGNSPFHSHIYDLLKQHPGAVVLHDFFLGHMLAYEELSQGKPRAWMKSMLQSHGYAAAQSCLSDRCDKAKIDQLVSFYPCNWEVLQYAKGIIVHSQQACQLTEQWYGKEVKEDWKIIPLLCDAPTHINRFSAREALGISQDAFVVCTFGFIQQTKLPRRLLQAWLSSQLNISPNCELIFVGESLDEEYTACLSQIISEQGDENKIRLTGWCSEEAYKQYLQAADIGVQLRSSSHGETSKAALDCMSYGLPLIVNAHGSMAELPSHTVWVLPNEFTDDELLNALETLWQNNRKRVQLSQNAREYILTQHNAKTAAKLYKEAIEVIYQDAATDTYELIKQITSSTQGHIPTNELQLIAQSIATSFKPKIRQKQLLVDVTTISRNDLKGGIERVVRAQLLELIKNPPPGFRIEPVYLSYKEGSWHYRYAQVYALKILNVPLPKELEDAPVDVYAGDILYVPDYAPHSVTAAANAGLYARWRALGVQINILVHDLLPILKPQFFVENAPKIHADWLLEIIKYADRMIGVSFSVARELDRWITEQNPSLDYPPKITALFHGADITASAPSLGLPKKTNIILNQLKQSVSFLMVGTIEPRKGHLLALEALEILWKEGVAVNLVIVGKEGWKNAPKNQRRTIPTIIKKLRRHPRRGKQLFWIEQASDEYLEALYAASTCLLAASEGEGFGLPLIEAAHHQLPILARDIPVFREVAQEHAYYFKGSNAQDLAISLKQWLEAYAQNKAPKSTHMKWSTWAENTEILKAILLGQGISDEWVWKKNTSAVLSNQEELELSQA